MYLGLDYGTSEIKALLLDGSGQTVCTHGLPLSIQRPHPQWSEQSAAEWWQVTHELMAAMREKAGAAWQQIQAIGLSGQMHGAVLLNEGNQVLRPVILWNDTRSAAECAELEAAVADLHDITGNLAMPGFTAPKLLWVKKHEPEIFARTASVLLPKDYIRFLMTGKKVSDMSDAAGMLWLDVAKRDWSDTVLAATGLSRSHMPELIEGSENSGTLLPEIAEKWGLRADVIVAGGGGDNAASAVGAGAVSPGDAFISLGTSGVVFVVNEAYRPAPKDAVHCFCHALPGRWHQMSVMLSAAACLSWYCKLIGIGEAELLAEIAELSAEQKAEAPLFLPYLSGERTPHNDPLAGGMFHGIRHSSNRAVMGYAVIEGVSFGIADGVRVLQESGTHIAQCSLLGGGARSPLWAQLLADTLRLPIVTHKGGETGGALGAARLAALATGAAEASVCTKPETAQVFTPQPQHADYLAARYASFRELYRQDRAFRQAQAV
ncbi:xylulokinase [Bergeriella denitrificans]|uniref:Xylulose kinase n=1 Tax=Bergeriella denitrificans TaxID=494 RepID=A0A378UFV2_BERDE|nr:xylulokinase [Bergeriella denitrificans]STZ76040.1 Xylulose kinase [Bergeriella denitrificans]